MTKSKSKNFKRIAVILLMAIFSIVGIISCGGEDITSSRRGGDAVTIPDGTGPETPEEPEPETPAFPADTYIKLYTPWVKWREYSGWNTNVSWQDTNTLTQLWKDTIAGGKNNDGKRWFIRDGDNYGYDHRWGNYYYFNKNFDIVHAGRYADKLRVKEFLGGVIVKYSGGRGTGRTWTIGGLYKTLLNKSDNNSYGEKGYTKYDNNNLNEFMRAIHRWEEGDLSIILMNVGYDDVYQEEFGVDQYYCTVDDNYRKDPTYYLGQNPNNYLGTDPNGYWEEKLNVRVNHSWKLYDFNFRFVYNTPYEWHLE